MQLIQGLIPILWWLLPSPAPKAPPAIIIPDQMTVLQTNIRIEPSGKPLIQEKINSLTRSTKYYNDYMNKCLAYFPVIERELRAVGVPDDFKFLALQESTLDGNAVSRSNAVGYWQFKQATAEEYQLRVDRYVDERRNVISSTRAAGQYFKKSHHYLQNWVYSLLSYNLGLTGARNFLNEKGLTQEVVVNGETHQYIVHFLAHYLAFNDTYRNRSMQAPAVYLLEYSGASGNTLDEVAQFVVGQSDPQYLQQYVENLNELNPWLLTDRVPNSPYCFSLILPVSIYQRQELINRLKPYSCGGKVRGHESQFYHDSLARMYPFLIDLPDKESTYPVDWVQANGVKAIQVEKKVKAKKFLSEQGISRDSFRLYNDGLKIRKMKPEQVYYLESKPDSIPLSYHLIKEGESLSFLAQKYGIKLDKLYEWNELDDTYKPEPGHKIRFNPIK